MTEAISPAQFVAHTIALADGELIGRTRLQKTLCLLELGGVGIGFSYSYHHYGPYSEQVSVAASDAGVLGLLTEDIQTAAWGGQYSVFRFNGDTPVADAQDPIKQLVMIAKDADGISLELAATAAFLASRGSESPWADVARLKPEKADSIEKSKALYGLIREANLPAELPAI